jgi:hypothetical protein
MHIVRSSSAVVVTDSLGRLARFCTLICGPNIGILFGGHLTEFLDAVEIPRWKMQLGTITMIPCDCSAREPILHLMILLSGKLIRF